MTAKTPEPLDLGPYKAWANAPWGMVAALVAEVDRLRDEIVVLEWRIRRERAAKLERIGSTSAHWCRCPDCERMWGNEAEPERDPAK